LVNRAKVENLLFNSAFPLRNITVKFQDIDVKWLSQAKK